MSKNPDPTPDEILALVSETEDELYAQGVPPRARSLKLPGLVMNKLGYEKVVIMGPSQPRLVRHIKAMHDQFFRPHDLAIGGVHGGVFVFRGIVGRIHMPIAFGTVSINPFHFSDFSEFQLNWICNTQKGQDDYLAAFCDIWDFGGGLGPIDGYRQPPGDSLAYFDRAAFQLQGAGAALIAAFDSRGAVQSALLAAELALKGGLLAKGEPENTLAKTYGHDLLKASKALNAHVSGFDLPRVETAIAILPKLVSNRYAKDQPEVMETGDIVMACQFIAAEAMRAVSGGRFMDRIKPADS